MRVVIVGGTGLIGRGLTQSLAAGGHQVDVVARRPGQPSSREAPVRFARWDGRSTSGWAHLVDGAEAVVSLAGETIGGTHLGQVFFQRWTRAKKRRILHSRVDAGHAIVEAIRQAERKPAVLVQASAVGYYGPRLDRLVDESDPPGDDFLAGVCLAWERATEEVEKLGVRRVVARTGLVLSLHGGLFPVVLLPFRLFAGGRIGNGRQGFSWIHAADHARAVRFLIENEDARGAYNVTAPNPVTNAELGRLVARRLRRPYWLPTPAFLLRLVLGEKATLVLDGQAVRPRRLLEAGFEFRYPTLEQALDDLLAR